MKYLWFLALEEDSAKFHFERLDEEKFKELLSTPHWIWDLSFDYEEDDLREEAFNFIQNIIKSARVLSKILELDLDEDKFLIRHDLHMTSFIWKCGLFEAKIESQDIKLRTTNSGIFRREQINMVFDFLDSVRKCGWL